MIWIVFGVLFLVLLVLFLLAILYEYCFSKKLEIQSILKKYFVHVLVVIFLFALITPLILYFFGLFKEKRALENSDILGYYGALIGGGVTVLGIYWTFNYERLISAEERKETSLPLLKFSLSTLTKDEDSDNTEPYDLHLYRGLEINVEYDDLMKEEWNLPYKLIKLKNKRINILIARNINIDSTITKLSKRYKDGCLNINLEKFKNKIEEFTKKNHEISNKISEIVFEQFSFYLTIENIGLQTAILSSMSLCSKEGISSRVQVVYENDTTEKPEILLTKDELTKLGMFAVPKETETILKIAFWYFDYKSNYSNKSNGSRDYDNGDYLLVEFTDVYLNRYRYKLPIKLRNFFGKYSVILDSKQIPINPEKI